MALSNAESRVYESLGLLMYLRILFYFFKSSLVNLYGFLVISMIEVSGAIIQVFYGFLLGYEIYGPVEERIEVQGRIGCLKGFEEISRMGQHLLMN